MPREVVRFGVITRDNPIYLLTQRSFGMQLVTHFINGGNGVHRAHIHTHTLYSNPHLRTLDNGYVFMIRPRWRSCVTIESCPFVYVL